MRIETKYNECWNLMVIFFLRVFIGCRESVIISHVENPSCFFVQLKELIHVLEKYRKFFAKAPSLSPLKVEDVKIGKTLLQCS